jgi:hypothetical protein
MNYKRIFLAALAAFFAYFVSGFLAVGLFLKDAYRPYSAIYRSEQEIMKVFPIGMVATFIALFVLAMIYAKGYEGGSGLVEGARFGALIGIFSDCMFVLHNYVNLNIGLKLTIEQAVAFFFEWIVVCIVIGLVYKPAPAAKP